METLLEQIDSPEDLKQLSEEQLKQLSEEIRDLIISTLSKTGGHLASSLGVVELSISLHYVFNTPEDKLVWDVSHQAYTHKILTGRRNRFHTIRQYRGISGFCKREESEYDASRSTVRGSHPLRREVTMYAMGVSSVQRTQG